MVNNLTCVVQVEVVRNKCNGDQCTKEKNTLRGWEIDKKWQPAMRQYSRKGFAEIQPAVDCMWIEYMALLIF